MNQRTEVEFRCSVLAVHLPNGTGSGGCSLLSPSWLAAFISGLTVRVGCAGRCRRRPGTQAAYARLHVERAAEGAWTEVGCSKTGCRLHSGESHPSAVPSPAAHRAMRWSASIALPGSSILEQRHISTPGHGPGIAHQPLHAGPNGRRVHPPARITRLRAEQFGGELPLRRSARDRVPRP